MLRSLGAVLHMRRAMCGAALLLACTPAPMRATPDAASANANATAREPELPSARPESASVDGGDTCATIDTSHAPYDEDALLTAAWDASGTMVAVQSGYVVDVRSGRVESTVAGHARFTNDDKRLVILDANDALWVREKNEPTSLRRIDEHVLAVTRGPRATGAAVVVTHRCAVSVLRFDVPDAQPTLSNEPAASPFLWTPRFVIWKGARMLHSVDVKSGERFETALAVSDGFLPAVIAAGGDVVAAVNDDHRLEVRDATLATPRWTRDGVTQVAVSESGDRILYRLQEPGAADKARLRLRVAAASDGHVLAERDISASEFVQGGRFASACSVDRVHIRHFDGKRVGVYGFCSIEDEFALDLESNRIVGHQHMGPGEYMDDATRLAKQCRASGLKGCPDAEPFQWITPHRLALLSTPRGMRVFDASAGTPGPLLENSAPQTRFEIAASGAYVLRHDDRTTSIWSTTTGRRAWVLVGPPPREPR